MNKSRVISLLVALALIYGFIAPVQADDVVTEIEKWVGRQVASLLESQFGAVNDPLLCKWVERVGEEVAQVSARPELRHDFRILDIPQINALALPGGYIFVTKGLLTSLNSEDELAGVLAHEVGHVSERHAMKHLAAVLAASLGLQYVREQADNTWSSVAALGSILALLRLSRKTEAQSDRRAIDFTHQAGYDPAGLLEFFETIGGPQEQSTLDTLLSTHPSTANRIRAARSHNILAEDNFESLVWRARSRRQHFQPGKAIALFKQALDIHPEDSQLRAELAETLTDCGRLLQAAEEYEILAKSSPSWQEKAQLLRRQHSQHQACLLPQKMPAEEQLGELLSKLEEKSAKLTQTAAEIDEELTRLAQDRKKNELLEEILWLDPKLRYVDVTWFYVLARTQTLILDIQKTYATLRQANQRAQQLDKEWLELIRELKNLTSKSHTPQTQELLEKDVEALMADALWAEQAAEEAAQACSSGTKSLEQAINLLTPVLVGLLDPWSREGNMSLAQALAWEAVLTKSEKKTGRALTEGKDAAENCFWGLIAFCQWHLDALFAEAIPPSHSLLVDMAAYRLGAERQTIEELMGEGLRFGETTVVLALAQSSGVAPRIAAGWSENHRWMELTKRKSWRPEPIYATINLLRKDISEGLGWSME